MPTRTQGAHQANVSTETGAADRLKSVLLEARGGCQLALAFRGRDEGREIPTEAIMMMDSMHTPLPAAQLRPTPDAKP